MSRRPLSAQNAQSRPNFVFEVEYAETNQLYQQFKREVAQYGSFAGSACSATNYLEWMVTDELYRLSWISSREFPLNITTWTR
jgi:hypothetical protein